MRYGRSPRQQPLEPASAGARARHHSQQELAALWAHRRATVDGKQELQHRKGRCVVAGVRLEVQIAVTQGRRKLRPGLEGLCGDFHRGRSRQAIEFPDDLASRPIDPEIGDPEPAQIFGHCRGSTGQPHRDVGRRVVALRDHHLDQVRDRKLEPGVHECVAKRSVPDHHHVGRDVDQLVETEFLLVHAIQHGSGDRHLVGAGHDEGLIAIERDDFLAADFLRRESYAPGKRRRDPLDRRSNGLSFRCLAVRRAEDGRRGNREGYDDMTILHTRFFLSTILRTQISPSIGGVWRHPLRHFAPLSRRT